MNPRDLTKRQRALTDKGIIDRDGELTPKGQKLAEEQADPWPEPDLPSDDYHRFLAPDPFPDGGLI